MKKLAIVFLIALALVPSTARAADSGSIVGQVFNATKGRPQEGALVTLRGGEADSSDEIERTVTTDSEGRYEFHDLPTGEERFYTVDAMHQGGFFPSRAISLPADTTQEPVIETTLRVWDPTTDPAAILLTRDDMFAVLGEQGIGMIESVTIVNQTNLAYIGRGGDTSSAEPAATIGFSLPTDCQNASVSIVDSDLDLPQLACTEYGFAVTSAIPPGEYRTTFSYNVPGETNTFDLTRTALYDINEMSVYAAEPLDIESNRLEERGEVTLAGQTYRRWTSTTPIDPGDPVQVLAIATATFPAGLAIGIVATLLVVATLAFLGFRRVRFKPRPGTTEEVTSEDKDLVKAIAKIDIAYENGDLSEPDWTAQRTELKERLASQNR